MEDKNNAANIIEYIVNITTITNKWLMWCEGNTPDQCIFVPSIFQMRDAYSHLIKLFGKGMENKTINSENDDFTSLFKEEYSIKQLEEAFTHCTRAFYDCADYILLVIKQDIDECEKNDNKMFLDLRNKLLKNETNIAKLRSAKSEDMQGNYDNIKNWDLFLQLITSSYSFGDIEFELLSIYNEVRTKLDIIENKFSSDIIKNHCPSFYEDKKIILELETKPSDFDEYLEDDGIVSAEVLENSEQWCKTIVEDINNRIKKGRAYSAQLDGLQKMMSSSNVIQKRNNILKAVWGFASVIISWITTNLLSSAFLFGLSTTLPEQSQTISSTKLNLFLLFPFIVICIIVFFVGYSIIKLISKGILKYQKKS